MVDRPPDIADIQRLFDKHLPSRDDQAVVFSQLLDSIAVCERAGSAAWSTTLLKDGFRLNVGHVEAMTCMFTVWAPGEFGNEHRTVFVNLRLLLAGEDCLEKLPVLPENASIEEMSYSVVGARHWCYAGTFESGADQVPDPARAVVAGHLDLLRANHHAFLELACRTATGNLRKKSNFAKHHSDALYAYARGVMGEAQVRSAVLHELAADDVPVRRMTPFARTRLEKAAADCGFECTPELADGALVLRSAQFPESVTVTMLSESSFALMASEPMLLPAAEVEGGAFRVQGVPQLYDVLEKAAAKARTMPDRVAQKFHQATAALPKSTEAERLVVQRVGQDLFRQALLDFWRGRCCITGLAVPELLRASHIKPWARCESDEERLDVFNGLLLAPHLDALFDGGWMSFTDEGEVLLSPALSGPAQQAIGFSALWRVNGLAGGHRPYLAYHRDQVLRR